MEVLDKYRLEAPLGEGAVARVYRAIDTSLQRLVAVKVLKLGVDSVERERFLGEAKALARLQSRHVLEVLDFGEANGSFYLVMPFVQVVAMADLASLRAEQGRTFTPLEAVALAKPVAMALGEAHRNQLIHRDVKPQNILVGPKPSVYLTDFGIARDLEGDPGLTAAGTVLGTPRYMAPEQIAGKKVDFSTDLYALGLVMFELVAGRLPGEEEGDLPGVLRKRRDGFTEPLPDWSPEGAALTQILDRLLLPQEDRQILTADELIEAFRPFETSPRVLATVADDARTLLERESPEAEVVTAGSPWTLMGQQANLLSQSSQDDLPDRLARISRPMGQVPPGLEPLQPRSKADRSPASSGDRTRGPSRPSRSPVDDSQSQSRGVPPLAGARVSRPAKKVVRRDRSPDRRALAAGGALTVLLVVIVLVRLMTGSGETTSPVGNMKATRGFAKIRLAWTGEARELSLATPRGHEALYDVSGRQLWESSRLNLSGVYRAALIDSSGRQTLVPAIDFTVTDARSIPPRLQRAFDRLQIQIDLPVPFQTRAIMRGSGLTVVRTASIAPSARQTLSLQFDPLEEASLKLFFTSLLDEEAASPRISVPSLTRAFREAVASSTELRARKMLEAWFPMLRRKRLYQGRLGASAERDIASLGLDAPFRGLAGAVAGFLESERVALQDKLQLLEAVQRQLDPDYFAERYELTRKSLLREALPRSWRSGTESTLRNPQNVPLPLTGIMTFKPKFVGDLALYDVMDEISRVETKELEVTLDDTGSIAAAEIALETWGLKPDQIFEVTVNGQMDLEMRLRGAEYRKSKLNRSTVWLYHPFDPALLLTGANRIRIGIRSVPGGIVTDTAALNSGALLLQRREQGAAQE